MSNHGSDSGNHDNSFVRIVCRQCNKLLHLIRLLGSLLLEQILSGFVTQLYYVDTSLIYVLHKYMIENLSKYKVANVQNTIFFFLHEVYYSGFRDFCLKTMNILAIRI